MSEVEPPTAGADGSPGELERLRARVKSLASDKSKLQLAIRLMNQFNAASGLDNSIDTLLKAVVSVVGAVNVILYYQIDQEVFYADALGQHRKVESIEDELVRKVFEMPAPIEIEHDFRDTLMHTSTFSPGYTWVYPLMVGRQLIGVLKAENLHIGMRGMFRELSILFSHAALILKNEIMGHTRLQSAYEEVSRANARLAHEIAERRLAEELVRVLNTQLEERVQERTAALSDAKEELQVELAQRQRAEEDLRLVNRSLRLVSQTNQALIRAQTEEELLHVVCTIAVDVGGYRMAWIGFAQDGPGRVVRPVCHAGYEKGYLDTVQVSWDDTELGLGPAGTSIRTGQPTYIRNTETDAAFAPWRQQALERGFRSTIALPLTVDGRQLGALALYRDKPDAFAPEEVQVLMEMASDLAYGIRALRTRDERQRAEDALRESEQRYALAQRAANMGSWDWQIGTGHMHWSEHVEPIFGFDRGQFPSTYEAFLNSVHAEDRPSVVDAMDAAVRAQKSYSLEHRIVRPAAPPGGESSIRWIAAAGEVYRNKEGVPGSMFGIVQDITERKRAELELENARQRLINAASERVARDAAETANRLKGEFLAHMSHEIRTPLHAILGLTYLAITPEISPETRDYLENIHSAGQTLQRLVDDILDLSKIEAGRLELERVEFGLQGVLDNLFTILAPKSREKGIELRLEVGSQVPCQLVGDPTRLGQVLRNLVGNAIKFTRVGEITVSVQAVPSDGEQVELQVAVQDTGIGMTPEQIQGLFRPFTQADSSTTRKYGGTGLGLAICKRLVELMGGQIGVHCPPSGGSVFRFTVPMEVGHTSPAASQNGPAGSPASLAGRGGRVLLVEDNPVNQRIARELMERAGLHVDVVGNGQEAVERVLGCGLECPWALILMDVQMPVLDGYAATQVIRQDPRFRNLPILALTAHVLTQEREHCYAAGMNDYIAKPIDVEAMFATLARWLPTQPAPAPVTDGQGDMPTIPALDTSAGLRRLAGNAPLYRQLLLDFAQSHGPTLGDLRAALAAGDVTRCARLAHALKGAAGNLGADSVARQAREVERLAGEDLKRGPELLAELEAALVEVSQSILAALATTETATVASTALNLDRARATLARLDTLLERSDGKALDCLEELTMCLGSAAPFSLTRLTELVRQVDFEAARTELNILEKQLVVDGSLKASKF